MVLRFKEFHGIQADIQIIEKDSTNDRYSVQKICPPKNGVIVMDHQ